MNTLLQGIEYHIVQAASLRRLARNAREGGDVRGAMFLERQARANEREARDLQALI